MQEWSFLTDNAVVLAYLTKQPGSAVRQIASVTGVSDRALHRIIADLVNAGYVTRKREGREFGYSVNPGFELHYRKGRFAPGFVGSPEIAKRLS